MVCVRLLYRLGVCEHVCGWMGDGWGGGAGEGVAIASWSRGLVLIYPSMEAVIIMLLLSSYHH